MARATAAAVMVGGNHLPEQSMQAAQNTVPPVPLALSPAPAPAPAPGSAVIPPLPGGGAVASLPLPPPPAGLHGMPVRLSSLSYSFVYKHIYRLLLPCTAVHFRCVCV